jgi:hypothetical protein
MKSDSDKIAEKHILIYKEIKNVAKDHLVNSKVYFGTHSQEPYQRLEKASGESFWGIRMYSSDIPSNHSFVKKPDVIVTDGFIKLLYILEVKWGWIPDFNVIHQSDLFALCENEELRNTRNAISMGRTCRVKTLKVAGRDSDILKPGDFKIKEETKFLLISDFYELMKSCSKYHIIMKSLNDYIPELTRLDYQQTHDSPFGVIQSFKEYISPMV